jgi:hypothetical protein
LSPSQTGDFSPEFAVSQKQISRFLVEPSFTKQAEGDVVVVEVEITVPSSPSHVVLIAPSVNCSEYVFVVVVEVLLVHRSLTSLYVLLHQLFVPHEWACPVLSSRPQIHSAEFSAEPSNTKHARLLPKHLNDFVLLVTVDRQ